MCFLLSGVAGLVIFKKWVAMMEIQFKLEDETSFMKYPPVCLFEMPRHNHQSLDWNLTTTINYIIWEIIMGYVSATFVRFATSPILFMGTNPAHQLSLALYPSIYHGFYISQVAVSNFFHQQWIKQKDAKKTRPSLTKKNAELYIPKLVQNIPTVESCWQSTKSFPSQKSHTGKGIPKCAECD